MKPEDIKKALYKEKPIAKFVRTKTEGVIRAVSHWVYSAKLNDGNEVLFEVPTKEMGEAGFSQDMPAQLLIRWLVK